MLLSLLFVVVVVIAVVVVVVVMVVDVVNEGKVKHLYDLCPGAAHRLELVEADLNQPECWPL